jgi:hypothetical protein
MFRLIVIKHSTSPWVTINFYCSDIFGDHFYRDIGLVSGRRKRKRVSTESASLSISLAGSGRIDDHSRGRSWTGSPWQLNR